MPRKNPPHPPRPPADAEASMRPRPDAAEKPPVHPRSTPLLDVASMRPRPDAAEKHLFSLIFFNARAWLQ